MYLRYFLLLSITLPLSLAAQVGVNTTAPDQALDVNGKLEIGDDQQSPTPGTLRFNGSETDFEGYDGAEWKSFTRNKTAGLPGTGAKPITAYSTNISAGEIESIIFETRVDNIDRTTPGPGEYFLVTSINVIPNFFTFAANRFALAFSVSNSQNSGFGDFDNSFRMTGSLDQQNFITSQTPILIIGPGQYLRVEAANANEATVNLNLRGFWVNSLEY